MTSKMNKTLIKEKNQNKDMKSLNNFTKKI